MPWIEKTHTVLPHSWLEKPRFSWGRECNGQLIREGSMEEESLKYLLGSALRGGVGGGEGDSGGGGGISPGKQQVPLRSFGGVRPLATQAFPP